MEVELDPKPSELTMSRVKEIEISVEARTRYRCNDMGRLVVSGNIPIELGDSWFSPKGL
jgi:hypothetical protein